MMERKQSARNYWLLVAEGILFTVGLVFFDPTTVLPLLMERLTGSAILVGVGAAIQPTAKAVVPILAGNWVMSLPRKRGYLVATVGTSRLALWVLAIALLLAPPGMTGLWVGLLLLVPMLFWFGDAAADPAWIDLVGKSVAFDRRGRFFATRQVAGGVLAVGAGALVARILASERLEFPTTYGVVVLIAALIFLLNVSTFVAMRERPGTAGERHSFRELIRALPAYLRSNRSFSRTVGTLVIYNFTRISLPFYVLFGRQVLELETATLALAIPMQMAGRIVGAVMSGFVGDRFGHGHAIRMFAAVAVMPPAVALVLALAGLPAVLPFALLFLAVGFVLESWPPFLNHMLAVVSEESRPIYAGLLGLGWLPAMLAPIIGGALIGWWGYELTFALTGLIALAGFASSIRLRG